MLDRWAFFRFCGECDEPTHLFEVCEYLGFNPGVDGHLYRSKKCAEEVWETFIKKVKEQPSENRVGPGKPWIDYPFDTLEDELQWLEESVDILQVQFPSKPAITVMKS